ncbi:PREDICTED: mitochondrial cardiolipin hydrolase-like [Drosophila arizonae]|uniref:Mitochondrial cardiolipin hydrolase n=1 Tax=Drosophila arizonae TaxID=7263 RepID=A0ABM1PXM0_DROAR|nr:PREDICTED: mitochondrial cardiolipin hydrolase-like [Drosophila arizonae]
MFEMWDYYFWKLVLITSSLIAAFEVIWLAYQLVCKWRKDRMQEVLIFNELGAVCAKEHLRFSLIGRVFYCTNENCSQKYVNRIIDNLNNAKFSIDLAMYSIGSIGMVSALMNALLRNVVVRIIVSQRNATLSCVLLDLVDRGAQLRCQDCDNFMQHKFCVIDEQGRVNRIRNKKRKNGPKTHGVLMNGSLNWTDSGFCGNWENVVITTNAEVVQAFQEEFDRMWIAFSTKTKFY